MDKETISRISNGFYELFKTDDYYHLHFDYNYLFANPFFSINKLKSLFEPKPIVNSAMEEYIFIQARYYEKSEIENGLRFLSLITISVLAKYVKFMAQDLINSITNDDSIKKRMYNAANSIYILLLKDSDSIFSTLLDFENITSNDYDDVCKYFESIKTFISNTIKTVKPDFIDTDELNIKNIFSLFLLNKIFENNLDSFIDDGLELLS